ncbi:MAG: TonB-dependent receptor [Acidobacteria bacterium]|nr:TonB-dependent receptor [Acidobacteriota bacterium]
MKHRRFILLLIICVFTAGMAFAQLTPGGKITGKVVDNQGVALPGVAVEATSTRLVGKAVTITDANGTFRLMALPSGTFDIVFSLSGFNTLNRKGIYLELSQTLALNVTLDQATVEEQVTVVGQAPLIDVKSTVKGQTMTKEVYLTLPRGRSFDSLISTIPGVQNESITAGISVDGASGAENMWYADGADIGDFHYGDRGQNVVLELLDEVKVTASGYNAEFGGSMGGVINVITRSGSNEFHGDIIGFYENNRSYMQGKSRTFLRRDPYASGYVYEYVNYDDLYFDGGKDRDRYNRFEGVFSLGGYIIKDKLWFFGSFNPSYNQTVASRDFSLREGPFQNFKAKNTGFGGSARLTAAPVKGLRLSASFINNFTNYRGALPTIIGNGSSTYEWEREGYNYPNLSASLTANYSIGNNLLISYRGGWHEQNQNNQQIAPPDESTYVFNTSNSIYASDPFYTDNPDLIQLGGWSSSTVYMETLRYLRGKIGNNVDVSYYLSAGGEHALKAGIGYNYIYEDRFTGAPHPRVYVNWGETTNDLDFNIGPDADPVGNPGDVYGQYGYYVVRGSFTSPYGSVWKIKSNNLSVYLQDSWTIKNRLTLNIGLRAESQYMPTFTDNQDYPGWTDNPVRFSLGDTLAPRLGAVYDVFGDSSLKIFGSFGIYYDVMKMYMGQLTFGGSKRVEDYYALNNPDWTAIAANGLLEDALDQAANGTNTYAGSMDYLPPSLNRVDPAMKPTSQREISFGAEKKLFENLSLSVRFVNKHLIRTIEDVGVYVREGTTVYQDFWVTNPGYGVSRWTTDGGQFDPMYWACPKATREYLGLNISLEKRFSHNWQGGLNYTLSKVYGNYSGLASSDEGGRLGPSVEQDFDRWFMGYDGQGNLLDGPLPQDRTHYFKAYGSYAFPFGLTVGAVAYGRSGLPLSTKVLYNSKYFYVNGREDMGRLPFTFWADLYMDYTLKIAGKYRASINFQINNVTSTDTIQSMITTPNRSSFTGYHPQILDGTFATDYESIIATRGIAHPMYGEWETRFGPWSGRLGLKFSF